MKNHVATPGLKDRLLRFSCISPTKSLRNASLFYAFVFIMSDYIKSLARPWGSTTTVTNIIVKHFYETHVQHVRPHTPTEILQIDSIGRRMQSYGFDRSTTSLSLLYFPPSPCRISARPCAITHWSSIEINNKLIYEKYKQQFVLMVRTFMLSCSLSEND